MFPKKNYKKYTRDIVNCTPYANEIRADKISFLESIEKKQRNVSRCILIPMQNKKKSATVLQVVQT